MLSIRLGTGENGVTMLQTSLGEARMNVHNNARLTPMGRQRMVRMMLSTQTAQAAARACGICPRSDNWNLHSA